MPRICLLALIGLPGAGKTRLSNWLLDQPTSLTGWNVLHLCYDDHFNIEFKNNTDYKTQRKLIHNLLTQLIAALQAGATELPAKVRGATTTAIGNNNNFLIVCDDNHYYRSMRYKLYQLCRSQNCLYAQIHVASSLDACLQGNESRGSDGVPPAVIRQMQTRLEPPSETDTGWERLSLTLTSTDYAAAAQTINGFIQSLLESQLVGTPLASVKQPQVQSLVHQLDLQLRARIQIRMDAIKEHQQKRIRSHALNEQRKQILAKFRLDMRNRQTDFSNLDLEYYVNLLS
ncbi:L-seryl-tRNA(Sec) kinase [Drosophila montana]|uniref:L-seryl-tRNA(Sec) kinase n=1 Tax=Drosophila montana TaxID=40370 RepID=UPI00313CE699